MSWRRCGVISAIECKNEVLSKLKKHRCVILHEGSTHFLVGYSGRTMVKLDSTSTLTLGVDGRDICWFKAGNDALASLYAARIELTAGFTIPIHLKEKLERYSAIFHLRRALGTLGLAEPYEDMGAWTLRVDVPMGPSTDKLMEALKLVAVHCSHPEYPVEHEAGYFEKSFGHSSGSWVDPSDHYVGPMASARFEIDGGTVVFNDSGSLLDGEEIRELVEE